MTSTPDKNALAAAAMPRVERIILHFAKQMGRHVDVDEIRSFALDGLAASIERFDPSYNVPVDVFAAKRVQGAILDGLSKNRMLPRRLQRQIAFLKKSAEMMQEEQRNPPPRDKVEVVHRLADRLKDLACAYVTSCDSGEDIELESDAVTDSEYIVARRSYYQQLHNCMSKLSDNQQTLIRQYFYEDETLEQIAERLGKSRSWASRNLQTALRSMRDHFGVGSPGMDSL